MEIQNQEDQQQDLRQELIPDSLSEKDAELIKEMMKAGLMYGHKSSKTHPKFKPYVCAVRNGIEIIDLSQTTPALEATVAFLRTKIKNKENGGAVLAVATQPAAKGIIEEFAKKFNFARIGERWIGGLLTNFKAVSGRIEYFKKVQSDLEKGSFEKYTKKERLLINRNIEKMRKMFGGLENLTKLPEVIFMIDSSIKGHMTAIREAKRMKIPIVAIVDSDDNPDIVDYPIPANDHARTSIEWIVSKLANGLQSGDYSDSHD